MPQVPPPLTDLEQALAECRLSLVEDRRARLQKYINLLWDWNEKINLTRHTTYPLFVARDLMDSWQLSELLNNGESILDVGTGGGVPGVVLAILKPELRVAVCDSVGKKARVVQQIVDELQLPVAVHALRAEQLLTEQRFDTLVARAVGSLARLCRWFAPHWSAFGRLLVVKGPGWVEERGEARHLGLMHNLHLRRVARYQTPGTGAKNVILQLSPKDRDEGRDE